MITLLQRRMDPGVGLGTKHLLVVGDKTLDVLTRCHAQCPVLIAEEVASQVKDQGTSALELEPESILENVAKLLRVSHSHCEVINIYANVLIRVVI